MVSWGRSCAAVVALGWAVCGAQAHDIVPQSSLQEAAAPLSVANDPLSADARTALRQILDRADHQGLPFAIVDKRAARLYVFGVHGELIGDSTVLLGLTRGDQAAADIAMRRPASLMPAERTTPAGRYSAEPGHNDKGEDIVWIDYQASLAIHRLRSSPAAERRAERLASANPDDKRISFGCVVVPVAFYDDVVRPTLGRSRAVVYVLPESGTWRDSWASRPVLSSSAR